MATARAVSQPADRLTTRDRRRLPGRSRGFGDLFHRHSPRLHAYVKRRLGLGLADDVVAEAYATAFRRRETSTGERSSVRGCEASPAM